MLQKLRLWPVYLLVVLVAEAAAGRTITFDDLYSVPRPTDPQISPDGLHIVFVLNTSDPVANLRDSQIWIMNADGSDQQPLTFGPGHASHPRWNADGAAVYFICDSSGSKQIWQVPSAGGDARRLTEISTGIARFVLAPNGKSALIITRVFPECASDSCNRERQRAVDATPSKARLYDRLLYRHYNRWDDGKVYRICRVDLNSGDYSELYHSSHNIPTAYLGGGTDFDVSPDGKDVCFSMSEDSIPAIAVNNDIYVLSSKDEVPQRVTENLGCDIMPSFSPDGHTIAYLQQARFGYESDQRDLILFDRKSGERRNLTAGFDRSVGDYVWAQDGKWIYFSAIHHGLNQVWRVKTDPGLIEPVLDDAVFDDVRVDPGGRFLVLRHSLSDEPYELYRYDLNEHQLSRLTAFTGRVVEELELTRARDFWFEGFNGDSVHGFLTLPPQFDPSAKYPLVLLIHGGPQWCWLGDFNYYGWNTQLVAAQGYVVVQIDPHGSIGYGLKFKEYVSTHWGMGDFDDLMLGVDYLLQNYPYIDSTRMAAMGRSYGGFMANWMCGHTDRFRCLISVSGTSNHIGKFGSTEELWFPEWEFGGTLWENWEEYERSSPIRYAEDFKTPTMIVHSQLDYRVDLSQGLLMFTALQRMGVPSQLYYFPDEGHSIGKLQNLRVVYEEQLAWLARWLY